MLEISKLEVGGYSAGLVSIYQFYTVTRKEFNL